MARVALIGISLLGSGVASVAAGQTDTEKDARIWLERMSSAVHTYNYDGIFIYLHGSEIQTVRIIHSVAGEQERERMVLLNGVPREVVRSNDKITYIVPKNRSLVLERRRNHPKSGFALLTPQRIDKLLGCYEVSLRGGDRVAGRDTQRLLIEPKDELRYGYRLWLDKETGLLLKSVLLTSARRPSEQFMFTSLRFLDSVPPALLEPEVSGKEFVFYQSRPGEADGEVGVPSWLATELPFGFELSARRRYSRGSGREGPMEQLVYSDGLSSVSVFIEPLKSERAALNGGSSLGAVNAYGTVRDGYQIIALGEVPAATVQQIATSIQRAGKAADD